MTSDHICRLRRFNSQSPFEALTNNKIMSNENQGVCRDFLAGVCDRGQRCKYDHPKGAGPNEHSGPKKLPICKDYQNKGCERRNCKFLHLSSDEEHFFKRNGEMPHRQPCRDWWNGKCDRDASKCKYRHISEKQFNLEQQIMAEVHGPMMGGPPPRGFGGPPIPPPGGRAPGGSPGGAPCKDFMNGRCQRKTCKFRHVTERELALEQQLAEEMPPPPMYGKRSRMDSGMAAPGVDDKDYKAENEVLKRKISELQKEVLDLREMNDALYTQNAKYRDQAMNAGTSTSVYTDFNY